MTTATLPATRTYKFRAECLHDVTQFLGGFMPFHGEEYRLACSCRWPDVTVEIDVFESVAIEDIRDIMRGLPDSHVMLDTLAPLDEYTGERTYTN